MEASHSFKSLDGLRGYMAWCVVFSHALSFTNTRVPLPLINRLLDGSKAVNVFIILSGFVITHLLITKAEPFRVYIIRRAFRLFPVYLICLLVAGIAVNSQIEFHNLPWVERSTIYVSGFDALLANPWPYILLHLTLLHGAIPDNILNFSSWAILGPAWSLSLEWQFYLLAPLVVGILRRGLFNALACGTVLVGLSYLVAVGYFGYWRYPSMIFCSIGFFLVGIFSRLWISRVLLASEYSVLILCCALALLVRQFSWEILVWGLLLWSIQIENKIRVVGAEKVNGLKTFFHLILSNKIASFLGKISYSIYLIHIPIFALMVTFGRHFFGFQNQMQAWIMIGISILLLPAVGYVLYEGVEKRFIQFGRGLT